LLSKQLNHNQAVVKIEPDLETITVLD